LSGLTRGTLYPQKLALISLKSGGRSVGIVRSRAQTTEFSFLVPIAIQAFVLTLHKPDDPLVIEVCRQSFNQSVTMSFTSSACVYLRAFLEPISHKFIRTGVEL
jgi:hypothetical protein